tara:strand:- start:116 stop:904 length:789 start_codon:yes stop_codon:yes gene_type:complete
MAETLTVNDAPENTGELSAEEQDSLQVGEQLVKEQGELLAGKYKNAEDLEQAYIELQKKLGDNDEAQEETEATKEEVLEEPKAEDNPASSLISEASKEFYDNDNKLSPETIEKFSELDSKQLISAYLESIKNAPQQTEQSEIELAQRDIDLIHSSVGGEKEYQKITEWSSQNLTEKQITSFDKAINSGDTDLIELAVAGIKAKYESSNGYEGRMLTGKTTSATDVFRSQAQLVQAMSDPRYDNDPAYRQDVIAKLEQSDLNF